MKLIKRILICLQKGGILPNILQEIYYAVKQLQRKI